MMLSAEATPASARWSARCTIVAWSMLAVIADVAFARVAFGTIAPSLRDDLSLSLAATGAANTANLLGYVTASPLAATAIRRMGLRNASVAGHLVAALGALLMSRSWSLAMILVARAITGFGGAIGLIAALRLTLDAFPPTRRAFVSTTTWIGISVGILLAASFQSVLLGHASWRAATAAWAVLIVVVALSTPRERPVLETGATRTGVSRPYTLVLVSYAGFGFAFLAFTTFLGLTGAGAVSSRWFYLGTAALVGGLLALRARSMERAYAAALFVPAAGAMLMAMHFPSGAFFVGMGLASTPALATAMVRSRVSASNASAGIANATLAVAVGQLAGPILTGAIADRFGLQVVPLVSAMVFGAAGAVALLDMSRTRKWRS